VLVRTSLVGFDFIRRDHFIDNDYKWFVTVLKSAHFSVFTLDLTGCWI